MKITRCDGEGQGSCKNCNTINWMCFLYKIEGHDGCYCSECADKIRREDRKIRLDGFLRELTLLTHKYGLEICGCGCCGSPYIEDRDTEEEVLRELTYIEEDQRYE